MYSIPKHLADISILLKIEIILELCLNECYCFSESLEKLRGVPSGELFPKDSKWLAGASERAYGKNNAAN